jgi:hypothetical protein
MPLPTSLAELETFTPQVERLARSRHWVSARDSVTTLCKQAFGTGLEDMKD